MSRPFIWLLGDTWGWDSITECKDGGNKPKRTVLTQDFSPYDYPVNPPPLPMNRRPGQGNPAKREKIKVIWWHFLTAIWKVSISCCLFIVLWGFFCFICNHWARAKIRFISLIILNITIKYTMSTYTLWGFRSDNHIYEVNPLNYHSVFTGHDTLQKIWWLTLASTAAFWRLAWLASTISHQINITANKDSCSTV